MMQTKKKQLIRQQQVLKALGYYAGLTDGIWGPASIKAKQDFEADPAFAPAVQNNGLPFDIQRSLPKGIKRDPNAVDLMWHDDIADIINKEQKPAEQPSVVGKLAEKPEVEAKTDAPETPVESKPAVDSSTKEDEAQQNKVKHVHVNKRHKR